MADCGRRFARFRSPFSVAPDDIDRASCDSILTDADCETSPIVPAKTRPLRSRSGYDIPPANIDTCVQNHRRRTLRILREWHREFLTTLPSEIPILFQSQFVLRKSAPAPSFPAGRSSAEVTPCRAAFANATPSNAKVHRPVPAASPTGHARNLTACRVFSRSSFISLPTRARSRMRHRSRVPAPRANASRVAQTHCTS